METLILGWYVLVETQSVLLLTVFASLQYLGTLLAPMFGVMGDRIGHRNLLCAMRAALRDARDDPDDLRVHWACLTPLLRARHRRGDGPGAPFGHRDARRAGRRHHAGRAS